MKNAAELQQRLNAFYATALSEARPCFSEQDLEALSAPFLIKISDEYLNAPLRIMFVGKETNNWKGQLNTFYDLDNPVEVMIERYEKQFSDNRWAKPFMAMFARVAKELAFNQPRSMIWNNLIKMDWSQGRSDSRNAINHSKALRELSCKFFDFETKLLEPHVIIFASGHSYDGAIKRLDGYNHTEEPIQKKALWRFAIGNAQCYRTRHPGARPKGKYRPTLEYYSYIINDIKQKFPNVYDPVT